MVTPLFLLLTDIPQIFCHLVNIMFRRDQPFRFVQKTLITVTFLLFQLLCVFFQEFFFQQQLFHMILPFFSFFLQFPGGPFLSLFQAFPGAGQIYAAFLPQRCIYKIILQNI